MSEDAFGTLVIILAILFSVAVLAAAVASVVWVYRDAEARGKTGCLWSLIVLITWPVGVLAYVLLRGRDVQL